MCQQLSINNSMVKEIQKKVGQLNNRLRSHLDSSSYQQIFYNCKQIANRTSYLINLTKLRIIPDLNDDVSFRQCIILITAMSKSTCYIQNSQKINLFDYLLRRYQNITGKQVEPTKFDISKRVQLNQNDQYFKNLNLWQISQRETTYLKDKNLNQDVVDIVNNQIRLPNNQCICCTQILIHDFQIKNNNHLFPHVIGLNENESNDVNLERYICALCNSGGGSIIIGVQIRNSKIWATGINFKSAYDVQQKQNQIRRSMACLRPEFEYTVDKIKVHSSFVDRENDIGDQQNRFCFRVKILPYEINKIHYIEIFNKGYHTLYESYQLNKNLKYFRVDSEGGDQDSADKLFSLIQRRYQNKKMKMANLHKGIKCSQPYQLPSKLFISYMSQNGSKLQKIGDKEKDDDYSLGDEPTFKYTYTSILAVGSKKKDRYIKDLVLFMKTKKMLFKQQKPFQNSFKEGSRSIWMFSHNDKHEILKNCIKECDNTGSITMIPIYKTLQIDKSRVDDNTQWQIKNKFIQRYPEGLKRQQLVMQDENGIIRNPVFMIFNCYTHAIYAYMIFESMQLRPYFVKENTIYKKKSKFKLE